MITKEIVMETVCSVYGLTEEQIRSASRRRDITDARKIIAWLLLDYGLCSRMSEVGREIGLCRNSVYKVLHCFGPLRTYDPAFRRRFYAVVNRLEDIGIEMEVNP